jgi:uncharacterized caspase-like protein
MVNNWALVIGINNYQFMQPLKYAKRNAKLMQQLLIDELDFKKVFLFTDESPDICGFPTQPNRANLLSFLQHLSEKTLMDPEDNFWVFFSGYGILDEKEYYLIPNNANAHDIENTAISINDVTELLRRSGTDNIALFLDTYCYQNKETSSQVKQQEQQIKLPTGTISIFSCSPQEYSYDIDTLQKSVFTHALTEALSSQGQCATVERLYQYLNFRVPELSQQYQQKQQIPYIIAESINKSQHILIPKYANLHETAIIKIYASQGQYSQESLQVRIDYTRLQELLADGNWKEADRETVNVILKAANQEKAGWLNVESINNLPYADLQTIDQLWHKYSEGRFGFSVQKRIWESVGGSNSTDYETWCKFCECVGWRVNNDWLLYYDLNFTNDAPEGHFPAKGLVNILTSWKGWTVGTFGCVVGFSAFASKLLKCDL